MTLIHQPDMSLEIADRLLTGVRRLAQQEGVRLAAAVVDRGGNLVAAARMDSAQLGAMSLATDKAYTAAAFGHPTSAWAASSAPGASDWGLGSTLGGRAIVFPGGVPVYADGELIGGLGVSGAASVIDAQCADKAVTAAGFASAR
jgi:uncharacterized protein GlcG (DUF336 family)